MTYNKDKRREQKRKWRKKYPEKVKAQRIRYYDKKIRKKIKENPEYLDIYKSRLLHEFVCLTRLLFKDKLPKICSNCGSTEDLQIHHIKYIYPILEEDLKVLCRKCHVLEHQKITPTFRGESPLFPMEK